MIKRTTIEIDQELLERARKALGETTATAAVEEALRRAADDPEASRGAKQRQYLEKLTERIDASVLASEEMWR